MNSQDVDKAIRALVHPFLKGQGFDTTTRRSWRHQEHKVDCVHFWAPYNWVEAEIKAITTFSFQIEIGIYFVNIPPEVHGPKEKDGHLLPRDSQCHIRRHLQPPAEQRGPSLPYLWFVAPDGTNLEEVMHSVKDTFQREALPWFDRFRDRQSFFELLLSDAVEDNETGWGYGRPNSPARNYLVGYIAKSFGQNETAIAHLTAYLESAKELGLGVYALVHDRVESDIVLMRSQLGGA